MENLKASVQPTRRKNLGEPKISNSIRTGFFDHEYDMRYISKGLALGTKDQVENPGTNYQHWFVLSPAVQSITPDHLFPTHGQFADWEIGTKPYPASMFQRHPGRRVS